MADSYGFEGKKAYVLGLGRTGLSTAAALEQAGVTVQGWDDNEETRVTAKSLLALVAPAAVVWDEIGGLIKSPGIPLDNPVVVAALKKGVALLSDFDLLYRREQGRGTQFIGITGTNGKSTVTALVGHILKHAGVPVAVGGNIGTAALSLPALPAGGMYVLECSSYQLEMTRELRVDAGVVLNLTPDHLARHGSLATYRDVKLTLLANAQPKAVKVLGVDQPLLAEVAAEISGVTTLSVAGHAATVSVGPRGELREGDALLADLSLFSPNLPGAHNWQNIAAALLLCRPWVPLADALQAVQTFKGLAHRLEMLRTVGGVTLVNDSKATNGDSSVPALAAFGDIYWIVGGLPKTDGLGETVKHLQNVRAAFAIGQAGPAFAAELRGLGVASQECGTLDVAVAQAFAAATAAVVKNGGQPAWVVLSPACASQDQFADFEQRGEAFRELVAKLG